MAKITVLVFCLIAICIEFQEISACLHEAAPCEKVFSCKTDEECNGGQCQGISSNWPYTGKCYCGRRAARIGNMKGRYLMENLFTPENLYKIASAIHKEIHSAIDAINAIKEKEEASENEMYPPNNPDKLLNKRHLY